MSAPRVRLGDLSVGFVQALADALLAAGVEPAAPVSYTHLRAHETSQDLVCRLLPEKKKTLGNSRRCET
ncbi:hypothetical protein KZ844_27720, partial [Pseudomonas aeruginosa]|nr:hypothetical protein [Pseudomonas aeruginosa]